MKNLVTFVLAAAFLLSLSACNTIAGVGKDVQKVGQAVEGVGRR
ncbi:MAG TPA: entericidin A/B family lipoprotein [Telluria sp.]|nr:entericidin A/B family lipoprotein [Telluria sp.]